MAYFFSLSVECGTEPLAEAVAEFFGDAWMAAPAHSVQVQKSSDGNWWVVVIPEAASTSGQSYPEADRSFATLGRAMLERLQSSPSYRFAQVGVESYEAISIGEMTSDLADDGDLADNYKGLVVSDELLERIGSPLGFEQFSPGYAWIPWP